MLKKMNYDKIDEEMDQYCEHLKWFLNDSADSKKTKILAIIQHDDGWTELVDLKGTSGYTITEVDSFIGEDLQYFTDSIKKVLLSEEI